MSYYKRKKRKDELFKNMFQMNMQIDKKNFVLQKQGELRNIILLS